MNGLLMPLPALPLPPYITSLLLLGIARVMKGFVVSSSWCLLCVGKWENADWKSHRCGWHSVFLSLCPLILCCCFCLSFLSAFVASPVAATVLRMPATIAGGSAPGKALKCFFMLCQLSQGNCLPLGQLPAACCLLHASCCLPHAASFAIAVSHASLLIRVAPGSCATTTRR